MTARSSRSGNDIGKTHESAEVGPKRQSDGDNGPAAKAADKPDYDERDRMATPDRKASGPRKRRRRSLPPSSKLPTTPDVAPPTVTERPPTDDDS